MPLLRLDAAMHDLVSKDTLDLLINSRVHRESFGPGTDRPCLAVDLDGSSSDHAAWLKDLPCPVIGIGDGPLAKACDVVLTDQCGLDQIMTNIAKAPIAAMILVQHLRSSETLDVQDTLTAESFAYATAQRGPEFLEWLKGYSKKTEATKFNDEQLLVNIENEKMHLTLNDPENHNAIGVTMRDAICEALDLALADGSFTRVTITGAGRCFSTGGDVDEFGEISDPATAHWVRSLRLPAWRLARLEDRLHVHVDGAVVGAGAEIAAFGSRVTATENAWFQLPELKYGLIPGAGGTASLPRRIGRQRTAYLALSMKRLDVQTALDWGLVDEILS